MKPESEDKLQLCSAYEIIMIVHVLHQMGYEQLRLKSVMSPSGMSWRWFIYPKALLTDNYYRDECKGDWLPFRTLKGSTDKGMPEGTNLVKAYDVLLHYSSYLEQARGEDKDYVRWFQTIVDHAQQGDFPISYCEYYNAKEWQFMNSKEDLPFPPFTPNK